MEWFSVTEDTEETQRPRSAETTSVVSVTPLCALWFMFS